MITPILNVEVPKAYLAQFELNLQTLKSEVKSEVKKHTKTLQNNLESYIYTLRKNNAVFPQNVLENYLLAQQYVKMLRVLLLTENLNVILNTVVKQEILSKLPLLQSKEPEDTIYLTSLVSELTSFSTLPLF